MTKRTYSYLNSSLSITLNLYPFFASLSLTLLFVASTSLRQQYLLKKMQCSLLQGYFKRIMLSKKNGDGSFALNPVSWTGPSLRDHLVKFFYRPSHDPAQAQQGNLPPSIKMGLKCVSIKIVWGEKCVPALNLFPISRSVVCPPQMEQLKRPSIVKYVNNIMLTCKMVANVLEGTVVR